MACVACVKSAPNHQKSINSAASGFMLGLFPDKSEAEAFKLLINYRMSINKVPHADHLKKKTQTPPPSMYS